MFITAQAVNGRDGCLSRVPSGAIWVNPYAGIGGMPYESWQRPDIGQWPLVIGA
ncbi:hypothetical protein GCM10010390_61660 [Streptomyces mordarskii]|uniref:Uncharacterized protein n=1 Tax=Streptomyces mordarskii TaxID=1226758 RepID=A0ABN1DSJ6_9ACTN